MRINSNRRILNRGLACIGLLAMPVFASAYRADCSTSTTGGSSPFTTTQIPSVFGEARGPLSAGRPTRFHAGIDIGNNCAENRKVFAIEGGRVTLGIPTLPSCNTGSSVVECVRVYNTSTGRAFDYVHVIPSVTEGQTVTAAQQIGTIQLGVDDGNHLHLDDRPSSLSPLINPQISGRLAWSENDPPEFSGTIGLSEEQEVVLIQSGTEASPVAFRYRNGKFYIRSGVDILATVRRQSDRKGVFIIGSDAYPIKIGDGQPFVGALTSAFQYLNDAPAVASEVQTIYWKRHPNPAGSDTYIASNLYFGGTTPQVMNSRWLSDLAFQGPQTICVTAKDNPYPNIHQAQSCPSVVVDNTGPEINMSNAGGSVADGGATSTGTITIAPTDPGGIYSITVAGVSYSSTNYPSGVQTSPSNTFPDSSVLADGSYVATVTDLAGNSTSNGFIIGRGQSLVENCA